MRFFPLGTGPGAATRRSSPEPGTALPAVTSRYPSCAAVAEALSVGESPLAACEALGRELALDGVSASEALDGLHRTFEDAVAAPPTFEAVSSMMVAWSETTLAAVNAISCEDPLTGLASRAHLRTQMGGIFRRHRAGGPAPRDSHALVVVDLPHDSRVLEDPFALTLQVTRAGEVLRSVFGGDEVVARVQRERLVALVERDERLGRRVKVLRTLVPGALGPRTGEIRVWIEGLPATESSCAFLLDELSRG